LLVWTKTPTGSCADENDNESAFVNLIE